MVKSFILVQRKVLKFNLELNSDIVMIMDECPKKTEDYDLIKKSMEVIFILGKKI